jgi:5-methylcytosine-specific restriction protein A
MENVMAAFTAAEYMAAFRRLQIAPHHLKMLQANYYAPDKTLTATMMAKIMGYQNYNAANLHYGKLGRLIGQELNWIPLPKFVVNVLVDFEKPEREWLWIMKPEVSEALEKLGLVGEEVPTIPEEINEAEPIFEGALKKVVVNAYERSNVARAKCLHHYGCKCVVCGTILSEIYGEIAQGFIHVHHIKQLSEVNAKYQVDPILDLLPVCPTCHAIIHLRKTPYLIEEVKQLMKAQKEKTTSSSKGAS